MKKLVERRLPWMLLSTLPLAGCNGPRYDAYYTVETGLRDVSILYADSLADETYLRPSDAGPHGQLLPNEIILSAMEMRQTKGLEPAGPWTLVALRIDPCANRAEEPGECENEIRGTFQPRAENSVLFDDFALHAIYSVTRVELSSFFVRYITLRNERLSALRDNAAVLPGPTLNVQALFSYDKEFAPEFKRIVLDHVGEANLTRVAWIVNDGKVDTDPLGNPLLEPFDQWEFGALLVQDGVGKPSPISTLQSTLVQVVQADPPPSGDYYSGDRNYAVSSFPLPVAEPDLTLLFNTQAALEAPQAQLSNAYRAARRLENPTKHDPSTTDCASCHLSHACERIVESWADVEVDEQDTYTSEFLLNTDSFMAAGTMRAFGYGPVGAVISQRTVNDSARVAQQMRELVPMPDLMMGLYEND